MDTKIIKERLDKLADYRCGNDAINMQKQELIDQILTTEIKAKIEEVNLEFAEKQDALNQNISALEEEIKKDVLEYKETVKGKFLMAVWNKGRISWDTKAMDGYVVNHPELLVFRKEGSPSISIRGI